MSLSLSEMKVKEIGKEATGMMSMRTVLLKKLAHFIGMLVTAKLAVPTALLHFHALQHLKISSLHQTESYQANVQLCPEVEEI